MSPEEIKQFTEDARKDGYTDEDMAKAFIALCVQGKIDVDDLKTLLAAVGYDLNQDIEKTLRENPESLGIDDEEKEESSKGNKEEKSEKSEKEDKVDNKSEKEDNKDEDEEKEWKEANKYFKLKD